METSTLSSSLPVTPPPVVQPKPLTKSQDAALRYLLNGDETALDHLIGICYKACRNLFIIDGHSEYVGPSGKENTIHTRRRDFVTEWLFAYLKPYQHAFADEIQLNVEDFRWIGRKCRLAFLKKIRDCVVCGKRKVKQCLTCNYRLSGVESNGKCKNCPRCQTALRGKYHLVCKKNCEPLSLRTSLDACYGDDEEGAKLSEYISVDKKPDVLGWIEIWKPELEELGLYSGLVAFATAFLDGKGIRDVTNVWARIEGISPRQARRKKSKFLTAVELHKEHALVRQAYKIIERATTGDTAIFHVSESQKTKEARLARSETAQLNQSFYREQRLSPDGIAEAESKVTEINASSLRADSDEIDSRKNREIASASGFVSSDAGFGDRERWAELEQIVASTPIEDILSHLGKSLDDPEEDSAEPVNEYGLTQKEMNRLLTELTDFKGYTGDEWEDSENGYDLDVSV